MTPSASKKGDLLQWERSKDLPWGLLILFGGGLSLAAQISSSGLGIWIGNSLLILNTVYSQSLDSNACEAYSSNELDSYWDAIGRCWDQSGII